MSSSSTSTLDRWVSCPESATTTKEQVEIDNTPRIRRRTREIAGVRGGVRATKSVENAIYAYIRALRALGRDKINTIDIAEALSLTVAEVNHAISALEKKGVKILNV